MTQYELAAQWEAYQKQLQEHPTDAPTLLAMADLLVDNGKADMALPYYRQVVALQPFHLKALYRMGSLLLKQQNEEAIPTFKKILGLLPANQETDLFRVRLLLAKAYRQQKQPEQTRTILHQILKKQPEHPSALNQLGQMEQDIGNVEQACTLFEKLVALQPQPANT